MAGRLTRQEVGGLVPNEGEILDGALKHPDAVIFAANAREAVMRGGGGEVDV